MSLDESEPRDPAGTAAGAETREIIDARTMRALAHPVRIAIIEQLGVAGPMTATEVGERIGESPTTCSFHLRQLAKYGFVAEAGGGQGRARPWRLKTFTFRLGKIQDNPGAQIAANAVGQLFRERLLGRYQAWQQTKSTYPLQWREASFESQQITYLTVEELAQLGEELGDFARSRFGDRTRNPSGRPAGSVPVEMLMFGFPMSPPASGDEPTGSTDPAGVGTTGAQGS
jgi:DNA-binding transcriptional ArsR family regulator